MSVRVTIEADWYTGKLRIESNDNGELVDKGLTQRIKDCAEAATTQAVAAINAPASKR